MMQIHYDRTPYRATGRHGSRVQQVNARRRREWRRAKNDLDNWRNNPRLQISNPQADERA